MAVTTLFISDLLQLGLATPQQEVGFMSPPLETGWTYETASIKEACWACFSVTPEAKL